MIDHPTFPTVNMNGTARDDLLAQVATAKSALRIAMDKFREMTPHGRDYQTAPEGDFEKARDQHFYRCAKLETFEQELHEIMLGIYNQRR